MLKRHACFLSVILFAIAVHGQSQPDEKIINNDLGFNTNIVLQSVFNSSGAPFSLMYKRYTAETKAWRFGLSSTFLISNPSTNGNSNNNTTYVFNNNASVYLSIGREAQRIITNKWTWYYGGDLLPGYSSYTTDQYSPVDVKILSSSNVTWSVAARPFLGMRFNISRQFYVSTEFSVNLTYSNLKRHEENFSDNLVSNANSTSYAMAFSPASSIFIFYRF